jgi:hypothetical protein
MYSQTENRQYSHSEVVKYAKLFDRALLKFLFRKR